MGEPSEPSPVDLREFDRAMNEKVLTYGSRGDRSCPRCHEVGYRLIADSEIMSLFACRKCGYQTEELHEPRAAVDQPFREYREGRGLIASYEDAPEEGNR